MKGMTFTAESVIGIASGIKTQTRRVIKPQPSANVSQIVQNLLAKEGLFAGEDANGRLCMDERGNVPKTYLWKPKYNVGDKVYVQETWYESTSLSIQTEIHYKADISEAEMKDERYSVKWRSPWHLSAAAARYFLRITGVRAERLQDISEADAKAEGANFTGGKNIGWQEKMKNSAIDRFRETWNKIHKKDGFGWETNPFVWVYSFEKIEKENVK